MKNEQFTKFLAKMQAIHDRKNQDYSHKGNPYSNFQEAAVAAGVTVEEVFSVLIGIKLSRLNVLRHSENGPLNESAQDTRRDLAGYAALLASYFGGEGDDDIR